MSREFIRLFKNRGAGERRDNLPAQSDISMYIYIYLYYLYLSKYICLYQYVSVYICINPHLSIHICINPYISVCISIHVYMSVCIRIYVYTYISVYKTEELESDNLSRQSDVSLTPTLRLQSEELVHRPLPAMSGRKIYTKTPC